MNGSRKGKVICLDTGETVLDDLEFPHDGFVCGGDFYISNTDANTVLIYQEVGDMNLINRQPDHVLSAEIRQERWRGSFQWWRGIAITERHIIVGVTQWREDTPNKPQIPPRLIFFDRKSKAFEGELFLPAQDDFPTPSIFTIHALSDEYGEDIDFGLLERSVPQPILVGQKQAKQVQEHLRVVHGQAEQDRTEQRQLQVTRAELAQLQCELSMLRGRLEQVEAEKAELASQAQRYETEQVQPEALSGELMQGTRQAEEEKMKSKKKLIMIMGVQRSGTNILRESLSQDPTITSFNESVESAVFLNWYLRPEGEIRGTLENASSAVLLKPISETRMREVSDVIEEYKNYELWIIWLYRDPVNVYSSQALKWEYIKRRDLDQFICDWNKRNTSVLSAVPRYGSKIIILKYEDLISSPEMFRSLCELVKIDGKYLFRKDSAEGRKKLSQNVIETIDQKTVPIISELDKKRRFAPFPKAKRAGSG